MTTALVHTCTQKLSTLSSPTLSPALAALDRDQGTFFENLDSYVVLRLLAENQVALGADVTWRFADVIEGGWQEEQALYEGVPSASRCLIVTEGSTDSLILSRSLAVVAPDLVDFFDFVDMSENYPFTGTGNLYRFLPAPSPYPNPESHLVVFDNDSAGRAAYNKVAALALPRRDEKVALLPQLSRLQAVCTVGPSGSAECDVNGLAVSIECFLDIWSDVNRPPVIRWMAYMPETQTYQGELAGKSDYLTSFLEAVKRGTPYDYSALRFLWQYLLGVTSGA